MRDEFALKNCPITGIEINNHKAQREYFKIRGIYYRLKYEGEDCYLGICESLFTLLTKDDEYLRNNRLGEDSKKLKEYLPLFLGEMGKSNFKELFDKTLHWNCPKPKEDPERHLNIKEIGQEVKSKKSYPQSRKEKMNLILSAIRNTQSFEGEKVQVMNNFGFWGKFYLRNEKEFEYYLKQFENQEYIQIEYPFVNLTFKGLDYTEGLISKATIQEELVAEEKMYQIGLSFAGENREFVERVAAELKNNGIRVFYDNYEKVNLWGKDLYQHLNDVYKNKCEYCIIFISEYYAKKLWTGHELKGAQTRAFTENKEYILPVRFDDTKLPGLNETVGYISAKNETPESIAQLAIEKLKK